MAAYASGMTQKQAIAARKSEAKKTPKKRGFKPAKDIKVEAVPF